MCRLLAEQACRQRDKVRADLDAADHRNLKLVREVDDRHANMETLNQSRLRLESERGPGQPYWDPLKNWFSLNLGFTLYTYLGLPKRLLGLSPKVFFFINWLLLLYLLSLGWWRLTSWLAGIWSRTFVIVCRLCAVSLSRRSRCCSSRRRKSVERCKKSSIFFRHRRKSWGWSWTQLHRWRVRTGPQN